MEWFKFYGGAYLSDPKMLMLTACERSCWITLLSFASVAEDGGKVKYLTEAQLMTAANLSPMHEEWDLTVGVLNKFEELGMITNSNGVVTVLNWGKRQESYLTNAERQKRFRDKQKNNAIVTPVLQDSNARIEENRIDKKDNPASRIIETVLDSEESTRVPKEKADPNTQKTLKYWKKKCQDNIGLVPSTGDPAMKAVIKRAHGHLSWPQMKEKIDEWFDSESLEDHEMVQITRCFSSVQIDKFKATNV